MAGSAKPCRPAIARRLAIRAVIFASALLSLLLLAAPLAVAVERASVGVNVESTEGLFSPWHYEVPYEQLLENEDVREEITTKFTGGGIEQIEVSGISFAKIAQLEELSVNKIDGMNLEQKNHPGMYTLTPAEIAGFSDGIKGDSDPVMAVIVLPSGDSSGEANLEPVFPMQAGREQERFITGPGKEALVLSIKVRGRVFTLGPIKASPPAPKEDQAVTFSLPTVELEGQPDSQVEYEWNFGDGETSTEASPVHEFSERGAYTVSVSVQDLANEATGAARPTIIHVTEKEPGGSPPPSGPPSCEEGGPPSCDGSPPPNGPGGGQGPPEGPTSGSPRGSSEGTTSGALRHKHDSPRQKHDGASVSAPEPESQRGHGHGGGEGDGTGPAAGAGVSGGSGGGPGGGSTGGENLGTGAQSESGHAEGPEVSELAGNASQGVTKPSDGAIHQSAATPAPSARDSATGSDRLIGVLIDPSSGALRRESGSQGGGTHPSPSLLSPGGSPGDDSSGDIVTWALIGASVLACVALGTISEMRPGRMRGRMRISGAGT